MGDFDLSMLEKKFNINFNNKDFLTQALTHRSYLNEHRDSKLGHNERLEFLGDAVLELVVTEYLYNNYDEAEGELTNWRASLVNSKMLAQTSEQLSIGDFMMMSRGETKDFDSKSRQYILANALEAIIGAIYLDQGWDASKKFILNNIVSKLPHILEHKLYMDPKSRFQEISQEKFSVTPNYKVVDENGPDHDKNFTIGLFLNNELVAKGKGSSKQEAQMDAAQNGLDAKGWE